MSTSVYGMGAVIQALILVYNFLFNELVHKICIVFFSLFLTPLQTNGILVGNGRLNLFI